MTLSLDRVEKDDGGDCGVWSGKPKVSIEVDGYMLGIVCGRGVCTLGVIDAD